MAVEKGTQREEATLPAFTSLASAFGLAIGELAVAVGRPRDVEIALRHAELVAKATLLSSELPRSQ